MPCPRPTNFGVLHNHLGVVVIDFVIQKLLGGSPNRLAASNHPVDRVRGVVPERETYGPAFAVAFAKRLLVFDKGLPPGPRDEIRLFRVQAAFSKNVSIPV